MKNTLLQRGIFMPLGVVARGEGYLTGGTTYSEYVVDVFRIRPGCIPNTSGMYSEYMHPRGMNTWGMGI